MRKVRVEDIPEKGLDLHFSDSREEWNRYLHAMPAGEFAIDEDLEATIRLRVSGKVIHVQGLFHTVLDLQCSRCLSNFPYPLTSKIDVTLFPEKDIVQEEEEVEPEIEDLKTSYFSGEEIDLSALIREQIFLSIPYKALCQEKCKGLCSHCGANLNGGDCKCDREARGSVFEVLKNLKLNGR